MWINYKKKIIYLCNPKCASTTIRYSLRNQDFINIGNELFDKFKSHHNHSPMKIIIDYLKFIKKDPYNFTYFTIIRNPIDRIISNFNYCKFDKNWNAKYSEQKQNALINFKKPYNFQYSEKYNHTINDYISVGLEKSSNLCTHPVRIVDFTEILNKKFNIYIFKMENLIKCKNFLKRFNISLNTNIRINTGTNKKNITDIKKTIKKKNLEKIYNLYKYEYTYYYNYL